MELEGGTLRVPMSDADIVAMQQRNAYRVAGVKQRMGELWLFHPANRVERAVHQSRRVNRVLTGERLTCYA